MHIKLRWGSPSQATRRSSCTRLCYSFRFDIGHIHMKRSVVYIFCLQTDINNIARRVINVYITFMNMCARLKLFFAVALSFEPWYSLYLSWHDGKDSKQFVWNCISEGLMEAPSSSVLTVYIAMLFNSVRHQGPSSLFVMSILTSLLSTSRASTSIGFDGENPSLAEYKRISKCNQHATNASTVLKFL